MRYPAFLTEGETIGFVAPSFGCNTEPYRSAFDAALGKFRNLGFGIALGPNCYEGSGIGISNSPEKCGKELTDMYLSEENQCILSCGGGELMCEVLEYIDWNTLKNARPKWYMGYSDNTNFVFLSATMLDTAAIYGPCAPAFGMKPWHSSIQDAYDLFTGRKKVFYGYDKWEKESKKDAEHPFEPYHVTEDSKIRVFHNSSNPMLTEVNESVTIQGRLLGGCMDCLVNLLGTEFDYVNLFNVKYASDGIIWFLESCDLNVYGIRRAIWQMIHAGWFQHVKGFIIGRPLCYGQEMMGLDHYHAVIDLLAEYKVPVIMDVDLGHLPPMMPIVCGSIANVSVHNHKFEISLEFR